MNFWRNLHPLLRRDNDVSYGSANYAVLNALADSLSDAEQDTINKKAQLILETSTGDCLDEWGSWFGVVRRTDETDDHYRERIKWYLLVPRSTIQGIITGIKYYLDDSDAKISVYEPWKNIFYLNKSKLNGDDHLQGFYYRYAVIDVSIDRPMSKTIYDAIMAFKPAGVKFYVTFNPNINSKVSKLTLAEPKARNLFTIEKAYGFMYDHKLPVTFSDRPDALVENTDYFKTNNSKLNGEDVLAGSPTHNVTYWNPLRLSYSPYRDVPVNLIVQSELKSGYIGRDTGGIYGGGHDFHSDNYIATNGATIFTFSSPDHVFKGSPQCTLAMYDSDKKYLASQSITTATQTLSNPNTVYIRFSINFVQEGGTVGKLSDWLANHRYKLEKGTTASPWSPNPADPEYFASTPTQRAILSSPSNTYVSLPLPSSNSPYKNLSENLYTDTQNFNNLSSWRSSNFWTKTTDTYKGLAVAQTTQDWNGLSQYVQVKKGDILTYSVYAKNISGIGTSTIYWGLNSQAEGSYSAAAPNPSANNVTITDSWQRVSGTTVVTSDGYLRPRLERTPKNTSTLQIAGIKVEKGNVATNWTPAPEDPEYLASAPTHMLSGTLSVYNQFIANYGSLLSTYSGNTEYDRVRSLVEDPNTTVFLVVNADVPLMINGVLYPAGLSSIPVDKGSLNYTGSDISVPVSVTGTQDARVYYVYAKLKVSKDTPGLGVNIKASQNVSIIKNGPVVGTAVVGTAVVGQETIISNTK